MSVVLVSSVFFGRHGGHPARNNLLRQFKELNAEDNKNCLVLFSVHRRLNDSPAACRTLSFTYLNHILIRSIGTGSWPNLFLTPEAVQSCR